MYQLKLRRIGNSLGATLPKEVLDKLHVTEGDTLFLTETPEGFQLTPFDPDFQAALEAFERTRKKYRNAFHALAR